MKLGRHRARASLFAALLHQVIRGRPVRMAIEQRADNAAVQHPGKRLMMRLGVPLGDDLVALGKLLICSPFSFAGPQPKQMLLGEYISCRDFSFPFACEFTTSWSRSNN